MLKLRIDYIASFSYINSKSRTQGYLVINAKGSTDQEATYAFLAEISTNFSSHVTDARRQFGAFSTNENHDFKSTCNEHLVLETLS